MDKDRPFRDNNDVSTIEDVHFLYGSNIVICGSTYRDDEHNAEGYSKNAEPGSSSSSEEIPDTHRCYSRTLVLLPLCPKKINVIWDEQIILLMILP